MRQHARRAYDYLGTHPYRTTFLRAMQMGVLHATWVKLLAGTAGESLRGPWVLLMVMATEWVMSRTTSGAVGFRLEQRHLKHIDDIWATGRMVGLLCGVSLVHVAFHLGREDPIGCLLRW